MLRFFLNDSIREVKWNVMCSVVDIIRSCFDLLQNLSPHCLFKRDRTVTLFIPLHQGYMVIPLTLFFTWEESMVLLRCLLIIEWSPKSAKFMTDTGVCSGFWLGVLAGVDCVDIFFLSDNGVRVLLFQVPQLYRINLHHLKLQQQKAIDLGIGYRD